MKLLLLRHGPAGDREKWKSAGRPDGKRPLTSAGKRKTARAAAGLRRALPGVHRLISSPLKRARQTAELAAREYEIEVELLPELARGASREKLFARLTALPSAATVALVGHEPDLSRLAAALTGARLTLKKAGAALIAVDGKPRPGAGQLEWLLAPRQLRGLAR